MMELFYKVWYFIIILPIIIFGEAYAIISKFMKENKLEWAWPYFLIGILLILLALLWGAGYR